MEKTTRNIFLSSKKIAFVSLSFLLIFFAISFARKWEKDKFLTQFLEHVMLRESGIYTLLGSKPISFINMSYTPPTKKNRLKKWNEFSDETKKNHKPKEIFFPSYNAQKLLRRWEKIGPAMTGSHYRYIELQNNELLFINIPLCTQIISERQKLFSIILELDLSPKEIVNHLGVKSSPIWDKISNNHLLCGLLCGFGLENSEGFQNTHLQKKDLPTFSTKPTNIYIKDHPKLSEINIPAFRVFPGGEHVVTKYKSERADILSSCPDREFKKMALKKLNDHHVSHH